MYPFVCGIRYWDEIDHEEKDTYLLLYSHSFSDAMNAVEDYFGENLISANIHCVAEEGSYFEVSKEVATALVKGCGDYTAGMEKENTH